LERWEGSAFLRASSSDLIDDLQCHISKSLS
jgi:hypothetical protein